VKYSQMRSVVHWKVYRRPCSTPKSGASRGSTFSTSHDPPGFTGARKSSHAAHRKMSATSDAHAAAHATFAFTSKASS